MRRSLSALILCVAVTTLPVMALAGDGPWSSFEKGTLNPGELSQATPADVGLPFERVSIPSGDRKLDGFLVRADASCRPALALLIFHGRNETVADWIAVQKYLHDKCVSSLVFDYSGHGKSSPPGTIDNMNADGVAALDAFLKLFPATGRRCLLSHSLGGGPMLYAATHGAAKPDCAIAASPFSSLRDIAIRGGAPEQAILKLPDVWNNVDAARSLSIPLLWVHSRSDKTIPFDLGQKVYDAKEGAKTSDVIDGFDHNAIYKEMPDAIWSPIIAFATAK
ncbi:alpha/beta hydrolase [Bradyrhizobium jicamae]|uniref:alpha/beta hydrolase n=1 Tax=Bradyrhizobium jicamae TaxID=280332 RepID=UPI001BADE8B7|nr:alpha/beta hydrolase [Bradyrhizobium jicamae]MBR0935365.1 alpha/beta fold hydrolase [Bradyrhizobium jicamae]